MRCRVSITHSEGRAGSILNGVEEKLVSWTLPSTELVTIDDQARKTHNSPVNLPAEAVSCCEQPGVTDEAGSALMASPYELEADLPWPLPFQRDFPPLDNPFSRRGCW